MRSFSTDGPGDSTSNGSQGWGHPPKYYFSKGPWYIKGHGSCAGWVMYMQYVNLHTSYKCSYMQQDFWWTKIDEPYMSDHVGSWISSVICHFLGDEVWACVDVHRLNGWNLPCMSENKGSGELDSWNEHHWLWSCTAYWNTNWILGETNMYLTFGPYTSRFAKIPLVHL